MSSAEFLVLSRGKWNADAAPEDIQRAIDEFYVWLDRRVAEGRIRRGHRLGVQGKKVTKQATVDGPFSEAKEVIGGYWFIVARDLDEAAALAAENPCLAFGLEYEVRPLELVRASAYAVTNETP
jgi:hypothetical protein